MNKPIYNPATARMQFRRCHSYFCEQIRASREQIIFNHNMGRDKRTWPQDLFTLGGVPRETK